MRGHGTAWNVSGQAVWDAAVVGWRRSSRRLVSSATVVTAGDMGSRAGLGTSDELVPWYSRFGFAEVGRERLGLLGDRRIGGA
jgi:hypothetical protein